MPKIVECVPNFSEGRDQKVIDAIANAVRDTEGVSLLDVDPGASTNRTVFTFVGSPEYIVEGALNAAKAAFPLIDMTKHKGEHPRMGALDVCPFIPVQDVTVQECVEIAKIFGQRLARTLDIPVFLYGAASEKDYRKTMPQIRSGEYEGLEEKLKLEPWQPDYGPAKFVPSWGGTVTGVRKFLIAYNINMVATKEQAHRIALNLRSRGRAKDEPGRLREVQGIGWWLAEKNIAQISLNLTDMDLTPMHVAYEEAKKDAEEMNLAVTGSEIVGLVPLQAILDAAHYYMEKDNLFVLHEDQKVHLAINRLGLTTLSPFNAKERIIEYCLPSAAGQLASQTVKDFVLSVGARSPAPGGGSVAALLGALGAGLSAMVGQLTYGKRQWEHLDGRMRQLIPVVDEASREMIDFIDADTNAFNDYMAALKMPRGTLEEKDGRSKAMEDGLKTAVNVPMNLAVKINSLWPTILELAKEGNINCKSDLQVGARCLCTAVHGAIHNVAINLKDIGDQQFCAKMNLQGDEQVTLAEENCNRVLHILSNRNK